MRIHPRGRGMKPERSTSHPMGISHSPKKRAPTPHAAPLRSYSRSAVAAAVGAAPSSATSSAVAEKAVATRTAAEFMNPKAANEPAANVLTARNNFKKYSAASD